MKSFKLTPERAETDELLAAKAAADKFLAELQNDLEAELTPIREKWAGAIQAIQDEVKRLDAELKKLLERRRAALFGAPQRPPAAYKVDLPHGFIYWGRENYIVKPKKIDVLALLERYGFEDLIRRTAAVDWAALSDPAEWPDEALSIIGTRWEIKETYSYEVKGQGPGARG